MEQSVFGDVAPGQNAFHVDKDTVQKLFHRNKVTIISGPDVCVRLFKNSAVQLVDMFYLSLTGHSNTRVPWLWKDSVIIPVPKCPKMLQTAESLEAYGTHLLSQCTPE